MELFFPKKIKNVVYFAGWEKDGAFGQLVDTPARPVGHSFLWQF